MPTAGAGSSPFAGRPFANPFGSGRTVYVWLRIWQIHDHEHAEDARKALGRSPV